MVERKRVSISFDRKKSRTKQSFKDECDVNVIMARFNKTGVLPDLIAKNPQFGDFSDVPSYQESLDRVMFAQAQFDALPAKLRERCGNDPAKFLEFVADPENAGELQKLGLAKPAPTPKEPSPAPKSGSQEPKDGIAGGDQQGTKSKGSKGGDA